MNAIAPGGWNINSNLQATNKTDKDGNPTGGTVSLVVGALNGPQAHVLSIRWQDGPRGTNPDGSLDAPNGAFVEDAIYAAYQRLEFFQNSKFKCDENARAMEGLRVALEALNERSTKRAERGVLGSHEV